MSQESENTEQVKREWKQVWLGGTVFIALSILIFGAVISFVTRNSRTSTETPKPPPPKCEVLVIDGAIVETFGMHLLAVETQEGQPLYSLVRCHNAPENLPIHMTFQQVGGQAIEADFLLERLSGTDPWELIGVGTPPAGEYEVHVSVEGQEVAWTWFRVVGTEPTP